MLAYFSLNSGGNALIDEKDFSIEFEFKGEKLSLNSITTALEPKLHEKLAN